MRTRGDWVKNIIRVKKDTNYVVMDKAFLNDTRLSWKAKGIMAYMLSMPDDWTFYLDELIKNSTDGKSSFRSGFNELKKNGYVRRERRKREDGTFKWETIVYERPYTDFPLMENPSVENPQVENQTLLNNNKLNNNKLSNDIKYIVEIVNYLNDVAGKNFRHTTRKTQTLVKARLKEGFTVDDFKRVIDNKTREWKHDPKMSKYLRPETLFGTKFESYLNEVPVEQNTTRKAARF